MTPSRAPKGYHVSKTHMFLRLWLKIGSVSKNEGEGDENVA